jgi:maltose alpha-D-glucosyltransferase/alpha-amylase
MLSANGLSGTVERLAFSVTDLLVNGMKGTEIKSKMHASNDALTGIAYNNQFLLKLYRRLDKVMNPDVELTRFLCEKAKFGHTPCYAGAVEWKLEKDRLVLGMMESLVEYHGTGQTYMLERFNNYIERILAGNHTETATAALQGTITEPVSFEELPEVLQTLLGSRTAEQAKLFGQRIGQMHLALAGSQVPELSPEPFSLHYQRSLFSSMLTLVRETFDNKQKNLQRMPARVRSQAEELLSMRDEVLETFKRIYSKKLDMLKIRIHGNLQLQNILLTGTDIAIHDFFGDPTTSFSERRLKRSALRDVAAMIRSFHNVAYEGLHYNNLLQKEEQEKFIPYAIMWSHYITGFFMKAYLQEVKGSGILPSEKQDLVLALQFYLMRKAMYDLNADLKHRPEWAIVPLRLMRAILRSETSNVKRETSLA